MWCESDISCVMAPAPSCALACDKAIIADISVKVCTCNHVFCIACWEMRAYRSCDYRLPFSVYYQTVWYGLGVYLPKRGFDHVVLGLSRYIATHSCNWVLFSYASLVANYSVESVIQDCGVHFVECKTGKSTGGMVRIKSSDKFTITAFSCLSL